MNDTAKAADTFSQLTEILDRVKTALKSGDFSALQKITDKQNRLFSQLQAQHRASALNPLQIKRLGQLAGQNQRYLMAARAGIRSAAHRRTDVGNACKISQTYDRKGQRARLETLPDSFEKHS
jgi:PBP1b-binding outer membrane lipoprotein LpoB